MNNKKLFPMLISALVFLLASIAIFFFTINYSWQFFVAYALFAIAGICAYFSVDNLRKKHPRTIPINIVFPVISCLLWAVTMTIAIWIGLIGNLPLRVFMLIEALPLVGFAFVVTVLQAIAQKAESEDAMTKIRDCEISELLNRISMLHSNAQKLDDACCKKICLRINEMREEIQYSDILSQHYCEEMVETLFEKITTIELELDAVLSVQTDDFNRLEELIAQFIISAKSNNEASKASKR